MYVLRNVNKYHEIWIVCEMFCSQRDAWKEGWCCLFSTSVLFVPVGGGEKPPLSWKSRQRHSTITTPFPTCYRSHTPPPLSPSFYWLPSERRQSLCVQLQELPLRSDSTPCRFHLLPCCCLCCKAFYHAWKSAVSHTLSLLRWFLQAN